MKISDIYAKYSVPPNLQEHMYGVAAVGRILVGFLKGKIDLDIDLVTTELLLHDMGNIVKYEFSNKHIQFSDDEIVRLQKVRADIMAKYGAEEHEVTLNIVREIGVSEKVIDILNNVGSSKIAQTIESDNWYRKVCSYADFRVAPYGIVSVDQRFDDAIKRYAGRDHVLADIQKTEGKRKNALILERQIQEKSSQSLAAIDDALIAPLLKELPDFEI
ncbi:MAG TPA: hypothetical protein VGE35_02830 [Candidatus Paceibacterota bacterium]